MSLAPQLTRAAFRRNQGCSLTQPQCSGRNQEMQHSQFWPLIYRHQCLNNVRSLFISPAGRDPRDMVHFVARSFVSFNQDGASDLPPFANLTLKVRVPRLASVPRGSWPDVSQGGMWPHVGGRSDSEVTR